MKICPKCSSEHDKPGNFCSRSCANGRTKSDDFRSRLSEKMKGRSGRVNENKGVELSPRKIVECNECGKTMRVPELSTRKYCSRDCSGKHAGGYREKSGRSKSGYYQGIYCGSTYELAWVIYRLDHGLPVKRFEGYIPYDSDGKQCKYYPDFVEGNIIHEMKGWSTKRTDPVLLAKETGAIAAGFEVKIYFKKDLISEFNWVKEHYQYNHVHELYDDYKPTYTYRCSFCGKEFSKDKRSKYDKVCCSRSCSLKLNRKVSGHNQYTKQQTPMTAGNGQ